MVRKLGGDDDAFIAYRTAQYKLHYYETPTNLRFALLTEPGALSMRNVLHQIYINLWVEYGECLLFSLCWVLEWERERDVALEGGKKKERKGRGGGETAWLKMQHKHYIYRENLADVLMCRIVVKNPLSPVEHKGGAGVRNEMFEMGLDKFIRGLM